MAKKRKRHVYKVKTCENCQKEYKPTGGGQKFCEHCVVEAQARLTERKIASFTTRKHIKKIRAIKQKGGKCAWCGRLYDGTNGAGFDFHHVKPKEDATATIKFSWCWERVEKEIQQCECVCAWCHRLFHSEKY